jgi:hypothetical protein
MWCSFTTCDVPDCNVTAAFVDTHFSTSTFCSIKYSRQFLYFTKISICVCRMIGYPVHSCSSTLTVTPVVVVVLTALIAELILDWGLFSRYVNSFEV